MYKKSFEDELDWKLLDQLHSVVSQISKYCFETKKICVTIEFIVITVLLKLTTNKLDHSLFVAGLLVPLCFWFIDAVAYYYQVKIRGTMEAIRLGLISRNTQQISLTSCEKIIDSARVQRSWIFRCTDAMINHSMWLYFILISIDIVLWMLFFAGIIA